MRFVSIACFLLLAGFALSACAADVSDFTEACVASSNLEEMICNCCAEKAKERLSPGGFDFLVATLQEDEAKIKELRPKLSPQEMMQAGMFMVGAPGECAAELGGQ